MGTKEIVHIRKEFNSHRICWNTNMAVVLMFWSTQLYQYGRRDVT